MNLPLYYSSLYFNILFSKCFEELANVCECQDTQKPAILKTATKKIQELQLEIQQLLAFKAYIQQAKIVEEKEEDNYYLSSSSSGIIRKKF